MTKRTSINKWIYRLTHSSNQSAVVFRQKKQNCTPAKRNAKVKQTIRNGQQQICVTGWVTKQVSQPQSHYALPSVVTQAFADELVRLHHMVWHLIRDHWHELSAKQIKQLTALDWHVWGNRASQSRNALLNGSGEDFLFFHRQMIQYYLNLMKQAQAKPIWWKELPQPGDNQLGNAIPPSWHIPTNPKLERRIATIKSDHFYWSRLKWVEYQFKNPIYLASLTLGELGSLLEYTIHNDLHMRWSAPPRDPVTHQIVPAGRPIDDLSHKWTLPEYDWLGEFYSSQVNPLFWRLHGWVDDRIEDWYRAHEKIHPGQVIRTVKGGVSWFYPGRWVQVKHPWVWPQSLGGYTHGHHAPYLREKRLASLRVVAQIITRFDRLQNQHYF